MDILKAIFILTILMVVFPLITRGQELEYNVETESVSEHVDKILNGPISKEGLKKLPYKTWFNRNYKTYLVDSETLKNLKRRKLKGLKIITFMGTWCHDSNREVPRLLRVVEDLGIADQLELYGVDVNKTSLKGREKAYNIRKTPTIIFIRDGKEIGRILEHPDVSWEQSFVEILN